MHPAGADVVRVAVLVDGVRLAAVAERTLKDHHVRAAQLLEARRHVQTRRAGACGANDTPEAGARTACVQRVAPRGKLSFTSDGTCSTQQEPRVSTGWRGGSPCARP